MKSQLNRPSSNLTRTIELQEKYHLPFTMDNDSDINLVAIRPSKKMVSTSKMACTSTRENKSTSTHQMPSLNLLMTPASTSQNKMVVKKPFKTDSAKINPFKTVTVSKNNPNRLPAITSKTARSTSTHTMPSMGTSTGNIPSQQSSLNYFTGHSRKPPRTKDRSTGIKKSKSKTRGTCTS